MPLWMQAGKIVGNESGSPIQCDECPCDVSPFPEHGECDCCVDGGPGYVRITLGGFENGIGPFPCENCADLNGEWELPWKELDGVCFWEVETDVPWCHGEVNYIIQFRLQCLDGTYWAATVNVILPGTGVIFGAKKEYESPATFDCYDFDFVPDIIETSIPQYCGPELPGFPTMQARSP